jgi:hypothetical protein
LTPVAETNLPMPRANNNGSGAGVTIIVVRYDVRRLVSRQTHRGECRKWIGRLWTRRACVRVGEGGVYFSDRQDGRVGKSGQICKRQAAFVSRAGCAAYCR